MQNQNQTKSEWKKGGNWSKFHSERNYLLQNWYFSIWYLVYPTDHMFSLENSLEIMFLSWIFIWNYGLTWKSIWNYVTTWKFISNFVFTWKFIWFIDLNFCSDVLCLKSQTFSNSCAKNRVIAWLYNWGMLVSGVAGRPPKNICLRSISNFSVSGCAGYWNWRSHLRQIFFGVRPATPDTITV